MAIKKLRMKSESSKPMLYLTSIDVLDLILVNDEIEMDYIDDERGIYVYNRIPSDYDEQVIVAINPIVERNREVYKTPSGYVLSGSNIDRATRIILYVGILLEHSPSREDKTSLRRIVVSCKKYGVDCHFYDNFYDWSNNNVENSVRVTFEGYDRNAHYSKPRDQRERHWEDDEHRYRHREERRSHRYEDAQYVKPKISTINWLKTLSYVDMALMLLELYYKKDYEGLSRTTRDFIERIINDDHNQADYYLDAIFLQRNRRENQDRLSFVLKNSNLSIKALLFLIKAKWKDKVRTYEAKTTRSNQRNKPRAKPDLKLLEYHPD